MNFEEGAAVKKLDLTGGKTYNGNAAEHFKNAKPFQFLPAKAN
jgi:choloylglycine hydrolase